jgi:anti-sigma factor RsiW
MTTCREWIEFLWQYKSGELSHTERATFDAHLVRCQPCVRYLKSYEETIKLGKSVFATPEEPVPDEAPEELVQAILAARATQT